MDLLLTRRLVMTTVNSAVSPQAALTGGVSLPMFVPERIWSASCPRQGSPSRPASVERSYEPFFRPFVSGRLAMGRMVVHQADEKPNVLFYRKLWHGEENWCRRLGSVHSDRTPPSRPITPELAEFP